MALHDILTSLRQHVSGNDDDVSCGIWKIDKSKGPNENKDNNMAVVMTTDIYNYLVTSATSSGHHMSEYHLHYTIHRGNILGMKRRPRKINVKIFSLPFNPAFLHMLG